MWLQSHISAKLLDVPSVLTVFYLCIFKNISIFKKTYYVDFEIAPILMSGAKMAAVVLYSGTKMAAGVMLIFALNSHKHWTATVEAKHCGCV